MTLRDPVSSASHLFFTIWAVYALLILIRIAPASRRPAACIYGVSMILLYTASGIFHGLPYTKPLNPIEFRFFQRLDQSAIFLLIAGTNTPLMTAVLTGTARRWCFTGMWLFALAGVACLWLLPKPPHEAIVLICVAMGWIGLLPAARYYRALGWRAMNWVWFGSALYTIGAISELAEWPVLSEYPVRFGYHEIFHVVSAAASVVFFVFMIRYVIDYRPREDVLQRPFDRPLTRDTTGRV